jgi:hypothetical protein
VFTSFTNVFDLWSSELTKEDIFRMFTETDKRLDKRFEETDRRLDKRFEETDKKCTNLIR